MWDICLTQLASHIPVELRVEIGRVDAICWGVNPWQLPLVESQELFGSVIDQGLGPGLTEWQNISRSACAAPMVGCEKMMSSQRVQHTNLCLWKSQSRGLLPSFRHSCEATELVKTTRFDRSLLSFIVFLFLPPLKQLSENWRWDEGREQARSREDKWDRCGECMKTRTLFKGSASKRCVCRTPTQEGKAVSKVRKIAMGLSLVSECMNNYKYYINFLSYFFGPLSKTAKAACKRGLYISGAGKPQERASKAKCLIGTIVHAVQQDTHTTTPRHICTHTHTHEPCTPVLLRESHITTRATCWICTLTVPMEVHLWIFNQERGEAWAETPRHLTHRRTKQREARHSSCSLTERKVRHRTCVMLEYNHTADKNNGPSFLLQEPGPVNKAKAFSPH